MAKYVEHHIIEVQCCGGSIRTRDLQVMSLASYQLLHSAINAQLLTGVTQNQYWRHLDPAAPSAARVESFCFTRISQFIEISEMATTSQRSLSTK